MNRNNKNLDYEIIIPNNVFDIFIINIFIKRIILFKTFENKIIKNKKFFII